MLILNEVLHAIIILIIIIIIVTRVITEKKEKTRVTFILVCKIFYFLCENMKSSTEGRKGKVRLGLSNDIY